MRGRRVEAKRTVCFCVLRGKWSRALLKERDGREECVCVCVAAGDRKGVALFRRGVKTLKHKEWEIPVIKKHKESVSV